jgi:hypothetical protein
MAVSSPFESLLVTILAIFYVDNGMPGVSDSQEDLSVLREQRRQTMVDSEIETSIRSAIVRLMELGLAVRRRRTGEIDEDSASRSVAMDRSMVVVVR